MKAWERENRHMAEAKLVLKDDVAENWLKYMENGNAADEKLKRDWESIVPGSLAPCHLILAAIGAVYNKGYDVTEAERLYEEGIRLFEAGNIIGLNAVTAKIYNALNEAGQRADSEYFKYTVYRDFKQIEDEVDFKTYAPYDVTTDEFARRIKFGWLAQIIGSVAGTQIEGYTFANIKAAVSRIDNYIKKPETYNDDITYELAFLDVFAQKGYGVTSKDIALSWVSIVPDGYSAEETALLNIRRGIMPPASGTFMNYYSDWIGAQMRTAIHGMAAPANPKLAAELAWKDSVVSHSNNGALGGVFNALLTSLAFVETDVRTIVELAVQMIPKKSEYYKVVAETLELCRRHDSWETVWDICESRYQEYHWIHVYPNAAAEVMALWFGNGDFTETLNIICLAGRDTDCNAAQILTVLGIIDGASIEEKWLKPIDDKVHTYLRKYRQFTITELSDITVNAVRAAVKGM